MDSTATDSSHVSACVASEPAPYTVYGEWYSLAFQKVAVVLEELGEKYNVEKVDLLGTKQQKQPEYLQKNPFGRVPVLEVGNFRIFESRAICRYILKKSGDKAKVLLGDTPEEQGIIDQWVEVESSMYSTPCVQLFFETLINVKLMGKTADPEKVEQFKGSLAKVLDVYEDILAKQEYLAGNHFTLADVVHLPETQAVICLGFSELYTSRPNVHAWWQRISQREVWKKVHGLNSVLAANN